MVFTGRLRFAEMNTNDLPESISSSRRRSSSDVHFVPRCCTAIKNETVLFFVFGPGRERANFALEAEMLKRGMFFEVIDWSEDRAKPSLAASRPPGLAR